MKVCPQQVDFIYNNLTLKTIENMLDINNQIDKQLYKDLDGKGNKHHQHQLPDSDQQEANNVAEKYSTEIPQHILDKLK
jgi:hypothetical protein